MTEQVAAAPAQQAQAVTGSVGLIEVFSVTKNGLLLEPFAGAALEPNEVVLAVCGQRVRSASGRAAPQDLNAFLANWISFTKGSLSSLNWSNVVIAGGSVNACLEPQIFGDEGARESFFSKEYPSSDIDVFMFGLSPVQAADKVKEICSAIAHEVTEPIKIIKSKHTVSITGSTISRKIQIIDRVFESPTDVLNSFDLDSVCFLFDGNSVFTNSRGFDSMRTQMNSYLAGYPSPVYELRLMKYMLRGYTIKLSKGDLPVISELPDLCEPDLVYTSSGTNLLVTLHQQLQSLPSLEERLSLLDKYERDHPDRVYARFKEGEGIETEGE